MSEYISYVRIGPDEGGTFYSISLDYMQDVTGAVSQQEEGKLFRLSVFESADVDEGPTVVFCQKKVAAKDVEPLIDKFGAPFTDKPANVSFLLTKAKASAGIALKKIAIEVKPSNMKLGQSTGFNEKLLKLGAEVVMEREAKKTGATALGLRTATAVLEKIKKDGFKHMKAAVDALGTCIPSGCVAMQIAESKASAEEKELLVQMLKPFDDYESLPASKGYPAQKFCKMESLTHKVAFIMSDNAVAKTIRSAINNNWFDLTTAAQRQTIASSVIMFSELCRNGAVRANKWSIVEIDDTSMQVIHAMTAQGVAGDPEVLRKVIVTYGRMRTQAQSLDGLTIPEEEKLKVFGDEDEMEELEGAEIIKADIPGGVISVEDVTEKAERMQGVFARRTKIAVANREARKDGSKAKGDPLPQINDSDVTQPLSSLLSMTLFAAGGAKCGGFKSRGLKERLAKTYPKTFASYYVPGVLYHIGAFRVNPKGAFIGDFSGLLAPGASIGVRALALCANMVENKRMAGKGDKQGMYYRPVKIKAAEKVALLGMLESSLTNSTPSAEAIENHMSALIKSFVERAASSAAGSGDEEAKESDSNAA